jgi:hypothetical protein
MRFISMHNPPAPSIHHAQCMHRTTGHSTRLRIINRSERQQILLTDVLKLSIASILILMLLNACGADPNPEISAKPESIAAREIAEFLSVPVSVVSIVSVTAQEFKDSSLDCPEPDMSYLQVLTAGHRVIVEADGRRFDVRVSGGHGRICHQSKAKPATPGTPPPAEVSELIDLARQDLARHLAIEPADIRVLEIHPLKPLDAVKGCSPECDTASKQCGFQIGLQYDERRYDYHVNKDKVAPCPPIRTM